MEIRDRLSEMESQSDYVVAHVNYLTDVYADTTAAFRLLEDVGKKLPDYLAHSREFQTRWDEEKTKIEEQLVDLDAFTDTYDGFLKAYDGLVVEAGRRDETLKKVKALAKKAMENFEQLHQGPFLCHKGPLAMLITAEDLAAREAFRRDQGRFLPSDIWSGLMDPPLQLEIVPVTRGLTSIAESVEHTMASGPNAEDDRPQKIRSSLRPLAATHPLHSINYALLHGYDNSRYPTEPLCGIFMIGMRRKCNPRLIFMT